MFFTSNVLTASFVLTAALDDEDKEVSRVGMGLGAERGRAPGCAVLPPCEVAGLLPGEQSHHIVPLGLHQGNPDRHSEALLSLHLCFPNVRLTASRQPWQFPHPTLSCIRSQLAGG